MYFESNEYRLFYSIINEYTASPLVQLMKGYIQHGSISTYEHSLNVAKMCYLIDKKFSLKSDKRVLLTSAILHDFYLYDWHNESIPRNKMHGFSHPDIATKNLKKYFHITSKEENAIQSHMWPLTITKLPKSREAWILCLADKYCAEKEILGGIAYKVALSSNKNGGKKMTNFFTSKRLIILTVIILAGIILGRLAVRAVLNLMLGGTLFGGNFL